jgi:hydroxyethylthiazole kinase-like uncharacterized protein yjeF
MGAEVLVACGPGNNGGDGYVAAAILKSAGVPVRVAASGEPMSDAARQAKAGWGGPVETLAKASSAPVLVDALFGTGLSRPLESGVTSALHRLHAAARLSIAIDLPSGAAADDGACLSELPAFDLTLALAALKPAHVLHPAAGRARAVRILDIGVPTRSDVMTLARPQLAPPGPNDHKFTRGLVAIVAGNMPGAAALAAVAAARSGAGYVLLLGSSTDRLPHAIVRRRSTPEALADDRIGALLIGPGLGRDQRAWDRLDAVMRNDKPVVLDGDALWLVAERGCPWTRTAPVIATPHAGEFAHTYGDTGTKIEAARSSARRTGSTIVYKGADTAIAHPDQQVRIAVDTPSWLSTAGTGDTLAGIAAALLARKHDPFAAASAAVWLHAEAARRAGPAFTADDLAEHLPRAIAACL